MTRGRVCGKPRLPECEPTKYEPWKRIRIRRICIRNYIRNLNVQWSKCYVTFAKDSISNSFRQANYVAFFRHFPIFQPR